MLASPKRGTPSLSPVPLAPPVALSVCFCLFFVFYSLTQLDHNKE